MKKISFITLGCKVNIYESNALKDSFRNMGYEIVDDNSYADAYIINTCSVTNQADAKSRKMIRHARSLNPDAIICALGCFVQTSPQEAKAMDEADILIGTGNKNRALKYVDEMLKSKTKNKVHEILPQRSQKIYEDMDATEFDHTRAFLKIEDGCSNFCSYCIIPYARGPVRCKDKDQVLKELNNIVELGYEEVVLSGIHIGVYKSGKYFLKDLIKDMMKVKGLKRIRISSIEINEVNDDIIKLMENSNIIADHIHLPLQSGCDKILKLMNRHYDTNKFLERVNAIRKVRPDISFTTDVIVGFPEETDEDFLETVNFIKKVGFSELHVFPYSKRKGTPAALMKQVDGNVKKKRVKELISLSHTLWDSYCKKFVGKDTDIIVETAFKDDYVVGHSTNYLHVLIDCDLSLLKKQVLVHLNSYKDGYMYASLISVME